MELFLPGRYFRDNLGYCPIGSPSPSSPRLQGWDCSPQGGFFWEFFPWDPHSHPHRGSRNGIFTQKRYLGGIMPWDLQDSGDGILAPGKVFWGKSGIFFPHGSPTPSSPRLREWNCSHQGGILGTIIPRGSPFPSSPGLQGQNLSLRVEFGGNLGCYSTFPSHPPHPSPPPPSPLGYSLNFPGYPKGHHRPNREAKLPSFPIPALPGRDFPLPASKTPLRGHRGGTLGAFCHLSRRGEKNPWISDPGTVRT